MDKNEGKTPQQISISTTAAKKSHRRRWPASPHHGARNTEYAHPDPGLNPQTGGPGAEAKGLNAEREHIGLNTCDAQCTIRTICVTRLLLSLPRVTTST
eukprot:432870-Pyramimonas_sp.AAC.1